MPNRLARETSPYLQQHADNPVDWYPWGEEALSEAKRSGKPILLSVGYSACHWCHVMAHESFEDPATAKLMNELFVNVKVDREERPDIDQIYQLAQQMLTQRNGGWPLTMFLTSDQVPFFGGTYFPNVSRYGMPAFSDLLRRVREFHDGHPDEIREQNAHLAAALGRMQPDAGATRAQFTQEPIVVAVQSLADSFDLEHGGFGSAPKFPHPDALELLLRRRAQGDEPGASMAIRTLRAMAHGGIYDQLGGGFARYSVDARWEIPHFEKMLYDNAWLLRVYSDAWAATREADFARIVEETAAWAMREMQSPEGGFYSSLDADSEGEEGKFYVWTQEEVAAVVSPQELAVARLAWGLDAPPNFEGHAWNLTLRRTADEVAREAGIDANEARARLAAARAKLFAARAPRVRPGRDEKILTSWNALMVWGLMRAARTFGRREWLDSARRALAFLRAKAWNGGRLLATYKDARAHLDAYLDDHAFLLAALLETLQADFDTADLRWAREVGDVLLERFHDASAGGFFFTAHDHESLIQRPKPGPDNATPSGNGVAAWALNRLSFLTGEPRYAEAAADTVALFWSQLARQPSACGSLLGALSELLEPPSTVIVRAAPDAFAAWREALDAAYQPTTIALFIPMAASDLPEPLAKPAQQKATAWVCRGATCLAPIDTPAKLRLTLGLETMEGQDQTTNPPRSPQ